jgi:hypothetical protein
MKVRDTILYDTLSRYIKGVCDSSLDWRWGNPQFEDLLDFLSSQKCVADMVYWWDPDVERRESISRWMFAFSYSYQERIGRLAWDEEVFNEVYKEFENFLYAKELIVTYVSPLYLFKCKLGEPVELGADAGIMPKQYNANIKRLVSTLGTEGKSFSEDYDWLIYTRRKILKSQPRESSSDDSKDSKKLEDVLASLRLLHRGPIHAGPLYSDDASPFAGIHGGYHRLFFHSILKRLPSDYIIFDPYTLKRAEITGMGQIYEKLVSLTSHQRKFLDIPLGRFHDSYERRNEGDKLIDLCIALESLYVREKDELAYRLALRCACFLEQDKEELAKTFRRVKDIYDCRSGIVHGTKALKEEQLSELVTDAEKYVRQSICKLLSDLRYVDGISKTPDQKGVLHFLDKTILDRFQGSYS